MLFVGWLVKRFFEMSHERESPHRTVEQSASPVMTQDLRPSFEQTINVYPPVAATPRPVAPVHVNETLSRDEADRVTTLERYVRRLQGQDRIIAAATEPIPPRVSGELIRLFKEINQSCPALLEPFEGHGKASQLRSQISTAVEKVRACIDDLKRGRAT